MISPSEAVGVWRVGASPEVDAERGVDCRVGARGGSGGGRGLSTRLMMCFSDMFHLGQGTMVCFNNNFSGHSLVEETQIRTRSYCTTQIQQASSLDEAAMDAFGCCMSDAPLLSVFRLPSSGLHVRPCTCDVEGATGEPMCGPLVVRGRHVSL